MSVKETPWRELQGAKAETATFRTPQHTAAGEQAPGSHNERR